MLAAIAGKLYTGSAATSTNESVGRISERRRGPGDEAVVATAAREVCLGAMPSKSVNATRARVEQGWRDPLCDREGRVRQGRLGGDADSGKNTGGAAACTNGAESVSVAKAVRCRDRGSAKEPSNDAARATKRDVYWWLYRSRLLPKLKLRLFP